MVVYTNRPHTRDILTTELLLDKFYSTGQAFPSVAENDQKRLLLANPSDSDVALLIIDPTIRATGRVDVDKTKNATIDTAGDEPDTGIVNKSSRNGSSLATAQLGGDNETGVFSGGTAFSTKIVGSGAGGSSAVPGSSAESGTTNIIYPGDNLVFSATTINGSRGISIDADFVEYPLRKIP